MLTGNKILFVLSFLAIIAGIIIYLEASSFQEKAKITGGIVIHRLGSTFHIRYTSDDGTEHVFRGSQKNNKHYEGDQVKVFYRTDDPSKARISDGKKGGRNVAIIGIIMLLFNIISVTQGKKQSSKVLTNHPEQ